jgi:ferrous iron transport protein A
MTTTRHISLADIPVGSQARIIGYLNQNRLCRSKLLALGLTKGTVVKCMGCAPMGNPIQIQVRGSNIALRKKEASIVMIDEIEVF